MVPTKNEMIKKQIKNFFITIFPLIQNLKELKKKLFLIESRNYAKLKNIYFY